MKSALNQRNENSEHQFNLMIKEIENILFNEIIDSLVKGKLVISNVIQKYSNVMKISYVLCDSAAYQGQLYTYIKATLEKFLNQHTIVSLESKIGSEFLIEFANQWDKIKLLIYWFKSLFIHLEYYLKDLNYMEDRGNTTICSKGLEMFYHIVFKKYSGKISFQLFKEIENAKTFLNAPFDKFRSIIDCLKTQGMKNPKIFKKGNDIIIEGNENLYFFETLFQKEYSKLLKIKFREFSQYWIDKKPQRAFIQYAIKALREEENLLENFIDKIIISQMLIQTTKVIIESFEKNYPKVISDELIDMFETQRFDELQEFYYLYSKNSELLNHLSNQFKSYLIDKELMLKKKLDSSKDSKKIIFSFVNQKKEFLQLISTYFENNTQFSNSVFLSFCQSIGNYYEFYFHISEFIDKTMRNDIKLENFGQDDILEEVIYFVRCLNQKDLFFKIYSKHLSIRLLNGYSFSREVELSFISRLNVEIGFNYVSKLSKMIEDIDTSKIIQKEFENYIEFNKTTSVEKNNFNIKLLCNANWQDLNFISLTIPKCLKNYINIFEQMLKIKESNKKLFWLFTHGNCEIKTNYLSKSYYLISTVIQFLILELFNHKNSFTFSEILKSLNLTEENSFTPLKFIVLPNRPLINKENIKVPKCSNSEILSLNPNFSYGSLRISLIPPFQMEEVLISKKEEFQGQLNHDRETLIDCIIVRIMKSRKIEYSQNLIGEVIHQSSLFNPSPDMIKQRIESLISREFIKRDQQNRNNLVYCP